jgi:DNA-binding response OmpR family regulator
MKKIIIIEGDASTRDVLSMIFDEEHYDVTLLEHGEQVLTDSIPCPDLFIIDRYLRDKNGLDVCRYIKASQDYSSTPVLMISAAPDFEPLAREAGAEAVLAKPFRIKTIREMVSRAVRGKYREYKS